MLDRTDLELYGELVEISFVSRIRGMVRFEGVDSLVETMAQDVVRTRELLAVGRDARATRDAAGRDRRLVPAQRALLLRARAARGGQEALRLGRTVPLLVLTGLAAAAAGAGLALVSSEFSFAPATLVTIGILAGLWYGLTALNARPIVTWALSADLRERAHPAADDEPGAAAVAAVHHLPVHQRRGLAGHLQARRRQPVADRAAVHPARGRLPAGAPARGGRPHRRPRGRPVPARRMSQHPARRDLPRAGRGPRVRPGVLRRGERLRTRQPRDGADDRPAGAGAPARRGGLRCSSWSSGRW